jgi:hypothetical protein
MNLIRLPRFLSILLLAVALSGSFLAGVAQDQPAPPRRDPYVISIDFAGGPLSKLVASLNADKETKLSIIQSAGLDPVLPAFSVRDARIESVIVALGRLLQPQGYMLDPTGPNLAVLSRIPEHRGQGFASLPLGDKLEGGVGKWTVEEIIAAIQLGCEFANPDGKASSLRFKYHPATKLLFAAGSEQEIDIAHRVFGSLPGKPSRGTPAPAAEKK